MAAFLVRVALPDRPGALGAVASRIGSVHGDVVGVEIVEHRDGCAIDEFVVELADEVNLPLLLAEIAEVDGARVEEVHAVARGAGDRRLDAYLGATALLGARTHEGVLDVLVQLVQREMHSGWAAIVDTAEPAILASTGRPPAAQWLAAHAAQSLVADEARETPDVVWAPLAAWDLVLVVGRPGWRFGMHEQRRLDALAGLADARWSEVADREARTAHPSSLV